MKDYDETRRAGRHFIGGRVEIDSTAVAPNVPPHAAQATVDVRFHVGALKAVDAKGNVVSTAPAIAPETYRVWLTWSDNHYRVMDFAQLVVK